MCKTDTNVVWAGYSLTGHAEPPGDVRCCFFRRLSFGLLGILLCWPSTVLAEAETFAQLLEESVSGNPIVLAQQAMASSARAGVNQAKWAFYPTPRVSVERQWFPGNERSSRGEVLSVGLEQPLWTGGELTAAVARARSEKEVSLVALEESKVNLAVKLVEVFGEWLTASRKKQAWEENLSTHRRLQNQLAARLETGVASRNDMTLVESRLASVKARYEQFSHQESVALERLTEVIGRSVSSDELAGLNVSALEVSLSLMRLTKMAMENHPTIQKAAFSLESAGHRKEEIEARQYPKLLVTAEREMPFSSDYEDSNVVALELRTRFGPGLSTLAEVESAGAQTESARYELEVAKRTIREKVVSDYSLVSTVALRVGALVEADRTSQVHIPAHREHPFRTNVNTYSG